MLTVVKKTKHELIKIRKKKKRFQEKIEIVKFRGWPRLQLPPFADAHGYSKTQVSVFSIYVFFEPLENNFQ